MLSLLLLLSVNPPFYPLNQNKRLNGDKDMTAKGTEKTVLRLPQIG